MLSFDGAKSSNNSMYHHHVLPAIANLTPRLGRYVVNVYRRDPPKLQYAIGDGTTAVKISVSYGEFGKEG